MEQNVIQNKTTRVGFVAADATAKTFDSGKKVTNVTIISGSGDNQQITYVRGWNAMADRLKDVKKGEKWEFKGQLNQEKSDGKTFEVMTAKEAYTHVKTQMQGEVRHIEDKKIRNTPMKNIMVVSSEMHGGREVNNVYNIELYGDKNIEKAKGINVGDIVSTKGHVRIYDYLKDGETKQNKSFQNPREISNHTRKKEVELEAGAATSKTNETHISNIAGNQKGKKLQM
jgi:hypothetical protein